VEANNLLDHLRFLGIDHMLPDIIQLNNLISDNESLRDAGSVVPSTFFDNFIDKGEILPESDV